MSRNELRVDTSGSRVPRVDEFLMSRNEYASTCTRAVRTFYESVISRNERIFGCTCRHTRYELLDARVVLSAWFEVEPREVEPRDDGTACTLRGPNEYII